jgi:hypothetical protein
MNLHLFSPPNNVCFIFIQSPYPVQSEKRYVTLPTTAVLLVCLATSQIQHNNSSTEYCSQSNRISLSTHLIINKQRAVPHHIYIYICVCVYIYKIYIHTHTHTYTYAIIYLHLFSPPNNVCFIFIQSPYAVQDM